MAEKKPSNREQVKQIVAGIEGSIQELFQSEQYTDYLRTMSRFHTYSVNNTIKAQTMLKRLDGLIVAQNVPVTDIPDTPERFMGDMLDLMDWLHAAGQIDKNFPPDNRDQLKAKLARDLQANPALVRSVLEKFVREDTGAAEAGALLARLDRLTQYVYKMELNLRAVGASDQHFIQVYERTEKGTLAPGQVLFFGTSDRCAGLLERLQSGQLGPNAFVQTSEARVSRYAARDGAEMDAFVGPDHKVYLACDDNDLCVRQQRFGFMDKVQAVEKGHIYVHQHNIGLSPIRLFQRHFSILRLCNNLQLVMLGHHSCQTSADNILIIGNQNFIHVNPPEWAGKSLPA